MSGDHRNKTHKSQTTKFTNLILLPFVSGLVMTVCESAALRSSQDCRRHFEGTTLPRSQSGRKKAC